MKKTPPRVIRIRSDKSKSLKKTIFKFVSDYKREKSKTRIWTKAPTLSA